MSVIARLEPLVVRTYPEGAPEKNPCFSWCFSCRPPPSSGLPTDERLKAFADGAGDPALAALLNTQTSITLFNP